jgi:hypothetical protein
VVRGGVGRRHRWTHGRRQLVDAVAHVDAVVLALVGRLVVVVESLVVVELVERVVALVDAVLVLHVAELDLVHVADALPVVVGFIVDVDRLHLDHVVR